MALTSKRLATPTRSNTSEMLITLESQAPASLLRINLFSPADIVAQYSDLVSNIVTLSEKTAMLEEKHFLSRNEAIIKKLLLSLYSK